MWRSMMVGWRHVRSSRYVLHIRRWLVWRRMMLRRWRVRRWWVLHVGWWLVVNGWWGMWGWDVPLGRRAMVVRLHLLWQDMMQRLLP